MEERIKVRCVNTRTGQSRRMNLKVAQSRKAKNLGWIIQDPNFEPVKITQEKMVDRPSCSAPEICEDVVNEEIEKPVIEVEEKQEAETPEPSPYDTMTKTEIMVELDKKEIKYSRAERKEFLLKKLKG